MSSLRRSVVWHHVLSLSSIESGVHADVAHFTSVVVPEETPGSDAKDTSEKLSDRQKEQTPVPEEWLQETLVFFYLKHINFFKLLYN